MKDPSWYLVFAFSKHYEENLEVKDDNRRFALHAPQVEVEAVGVQDFAIQFYEFCPDMRSSSKLFAMCRFFSFYARKNYSGKVGLIFKERSSIFCLCSSFLGRKCMVQGFLDILFY